MSEASAPRRSGGELTVHPVGPDEHDLVVALAGTALGWRDGEPNAALFRWKHLDNPFGPSPMWLARVDGEPAGFRTLLRWSFDSPDGPRSAVRAVDTATLPAYEGRGVFRTLTLHALGEVRGEGVDFVFNTPNDQSRPGYLKMGWEVVGAVPVGVAVRTPGAALRVARARVPAAKWSLDCEVGEAAADVLADDASAGALDDLLASQPAPRGLRTRRTPAFLRWRYAAGPLRYRALLGSGGRVEDGLVLFRLRRRGPAVEATVCDVLVPGGEPRALAALTRELLRRARPDYAIRVQPRARDGRFVRLPGQGPLLTWRGVNRTARPDLGDWDLRLGDLELF